MKLKDELLAIAGETLDQGFPTTKALIANLMREAARKGRGWLLIEATTLEAERQLLEWGEAQGLKTRATTLGMVGRGLIFSWGYEPILLGLADAMVMPDGSLRLREVGD